METKADVYLMKTLSYLWMMLKAPWRASQALAQEVRVRYAGALVLSYGIFGSLGFLLSAIQRDYPPPAETLEVWIQAWGEFAMLPFLKIPAENYRAFQAVIMIPLALAIWMLMAGTARLLALLFNGRVRYEQYLNLVGFGFFPFLWIAAILDLFYSGVLRSYAVPALNMEYGELARGFFLWFPPVEYMILYGLGGVYNGIAAQSTERWAAWKSVALGALTFLWPMLLISTLLR
jgi:hypothetical protein